jgi:hypothetical protein
MSKEYRVSAKSELATAETCKDLIESYWARRGLKVKVSMRVQGMGKKAPSIINVRSDMLDGYPNGGVA